MIPLADIQHANDWQAQLRNAVSSGEELLALLRLDSQQAGLCAAASADFALKVPRSFVARMRPQDANDPLLRQVLSHQLEMQPTPGYSDDPVGETGDAITHPGIIQKYHGRALLVLAGACAINCRYCFRRHFPYSDNRNSRQQWREALQHIAADPSISEVILSGGDPLLVADRELAALTKALAAIPHLRRLRVHSRMPVVLPARITDGLLAALTGTRLQPVMVVHSNHGNEINDEVEAATAKLGDARIPILNQAVLLAGVNDSADTLAELSEKLFAAGVLPYYLHLLDKVRGAAHFDVPEQRGLQLIGELENRLPGYLVPTLVREEAGKPAKVRVRGA
ncbi:EF-P beta-lysylation protein EpmB [Seongchinamella sediminis]|uniref:L-lysine 2,3-aminomutase n=1 Tax=Seongchinamella sediminis TaxID=2283635 RepID=A0A3L7E0R3_9GAMM|nr:EF-P beta-lysylation protein EpmB [Seongchinamella sediminis]RLQ21831.1 EF-P beta-lysylation protein EpmB [Seongchinamella sediminis]